MERKIQKRFVDHGFGFPVILLDMPMVRVRGNWTPEINYNELTKVVLHALCYKPARLTGNEIRFIRTHFGMTLKQFANRFCVTHPGVLKWEKAGEKPTAMNWTTEKDIRLFVLSKIGARPKDWTGLYSQLETLPTDKPVPICVHAEDLAA